MSFGTLLRMLRLSVARGRILRTSHETVPRSAQTKLHDGEVLDGVHVIQEYGSASRPLEGAECVVVCVAADRSHPVVIATHDRRHPGPTLNPGDKAIFAASGPTVICRYGGGLEISGDVTITGDVLVEGSVSASGDLEDETGSLAALRGGYNIHTHVASGSPTSTPNPTVGV